MDEMNAIEPMYLTPQRPLNPFVVMIAVIVGVFTVVALIVGIIIGWSSFLQVGLTIFYLVACAVILGIIAAVVFGVRSFAKHQHHKERERDLELTRAENALHAEKQMNEARAAMMMAEAIYKRRTALVPDGLGNAFNTDDYGNLAARIGNAQVPHSIHYSIKTDNQLVESQAQNLLNAPQFALPHIDMFYQAIPFNSLQTGMGIEALTGKPIITPIMGSTHFKLIGGSGMGKSCVAASILDIATTTNDPDHLRIGLLDLEHNTSRLFENLPHVYEIGPRRQRLVGRDPDEVAQKLQLLQWELNRRAGLGEAHCREHEPVLLVYVEEMLALKYEVVDEDLKKKMLAAINILGVRARKYGIFLLVCMQIDYSDKSTREAMAQFRTRAGFAIDPEAARASGFFDTELVKQNFLAGRSGQYVLEKPQFSGIVLAPDYDVRAKLEAPRTSGSASQGTILPFNSSVVEASEAYPEASTEALAKPTLRLASGANGEAFTAQELRYVRKFVQEGLTTSQIVSSEFTNSKGDPLTSGDKFMQRSKEVQDVIRRYLAAKEVS